MPRAFDLHPYETLGDNTPLAGVVACEAHWQRKTWELRVIHRPEGVSLVFRNKNKGAAHCFLMSGFEPNFYEDRIDNASLRHNFARAVGQNAWGRVLQLDRDLEPITAGTPRASLGIAVTLHANGTGCWRASPMSGATQFALQRAQFRHGLSPAQLLSWPTPRLVSHLQTGIADPCDDDIGFAHRLMPLDGFKVATLAFVWARGDAMQWRQVMSWIVATNWVWPPELESLQWRIYPRIPGDYVGNTGEKTIPSLVPDHDNNYDFDAVPAQKALLERLRQAHFYFDPQLDLELCARHQYFSDKIGYRRGLWFGLGFTPPTAHEQLEAMMKLRDWNSANGAPLALGS